jgi:hypothetical protein
MGNGLYRRLLATLLSYVFMVLCPNLGAEQTEQVKHLIAGYPRARILTECPPAN